MTSSTQLHIIVFKELTQTIFQPEQLMVWSFSSDLNRYYGYVKANATTGFVQAEADAQKVREIIFTNVNSNIRSTSNDRWGSYF